MTSHDPHGDPSGCGRTTPSRITIRRHPLHPMLVVYPVAFLSAMPATDLLYLWTHTLAWAQASLVLAIAGLAIGVPAALAGFLDLMLVGVVRRSISAWSHALAAVMLMAVAAGNVWLRWPEPAAVVWPAGLVLSATAFVLVMVTGWLGGSLTFRDGIGVYGSAPPGRTGDDAASPRG